MTRVFVRCDYDAARERLIDKLTRAGFACTILESGAEEVPAGGHPPLPDAREAGSPPLSGASCARGQAAEVSPAARESSSPANEGAEAALLCVPKTGRGGWAEEAISLADRVLVLTARPARVAHSHTMDFGDVPPLKRREQPGFSGWFERLWGELNA